MRLVQCNRLVDEISSSFLLSFSYNAECTPFECIYDHVPQTKPLLLSKLTHLIIDKIKDYNNPSHYQRATKMSHYSLFFYIALELYYFTTN